MQRRFEYDIGGFDDVEHLTLHLGKIDTYKFLIESDGDRCLPAQLCHKSPLIHLHRLFDGVDSILSQLLQLTQSLSRTEGSVGIHSQLKFPMGETLAHTFDEVKLFLEIYASYLEFDTSVALLYLLLHALEHLFMTPHPNQSVDRDSLLSATVGGVEEGE